MEETNKYSLGKVGRPPTFTDPNAFDEKVQEYFIYIQNKERATVTGLALFLGFADKTSLYEYRKKDEFSYSVNRAISIIENQHELRLFEDRPHGSIFALKNFGWDDTIKTENKTELITSIKIVDIDGSEL